MRAGSAARTSLRGTEALASVETGSVMSSDGGAPLCAGMLATGGPRTALLPMPGLSVEFIAARRPMAMPMEGAGNPWR